MALLVEVVVDGAVYRGKFLQTSHLSEAKHGPFTSSERLVTVFSAIIQPFSDGSRVSTHQFFEGCAVGCQAVSHDCLRRTVSSKRFPEEFQRGLAITGLGDEAFEHFAFMIDRAPEVMFDAVDFDENFVEMPTAMPECAHGCGSISTDLGSKYLTKAVPPEAYRLMCDVDSALVQEILNVPQRKRISNIHHHRQTDDSGKVLKYRNGSIVVVMRRYQPCRARQSILI